MTASDQDYSLEISQAALNLLGAYNILARARLSQLIVSLSGPNMVRLQEELPALIDGLDFLYLLLTKWLSSPRILQDFLNEEAGEDGEYQEVEQ